jgi:protein tyrosine/serine phosphatase
VIKIFKQKMASKIVDQIWVGSEFSARDLEFLKKEKINVIVNCTKTVPFCEAFRALAQCHALYRIPIDDPGNVSWSTDHELLGKLLPEITKKLYRHAQTGDNILIHCHAGIQRSASVAAAMLVRYGVWRYSKKNEEYKQKIYRATIRFMTKKRQVVFYEGKSVNFENVLIEFANSAEIHLT